MAEVKKLYRSKSNRVLGGVCAGLAEYLNMDPVVVRIGWIALTLISLGLGLLLYIIMWVVVPEK